MPQLKTDPATLIAAGRRALEIEGRALAALVAAARRDFRARLHLCLDCHGRVIVTGMGKSGHIGSKIAATLASTGTPSFFMHAAEASHGDIGMITREDVVLAMSNSGETAEVLLLIPHLSRLGVPIIAMTGNPAVDTGARRDGPPRRERRRGSLPAQSGAHRQHHGDARASATRWPSRCSKRAASRRRISRARIPAARSAASCCCTSQTSCAPGDDLPVVGPQDVARRRPGRDVEEGSRHVRRRR